MTPTPSPAPRPAPLPATAPPLDSPLVFALVLALLLGTSCGGPAPQSDGGDGGTEPGGVRVVDGPGENGESLQGLIANMTSVEGGGGDMGDGDTEAEGEEGEEGEPDEPLAPGLHYRLSDAGGAAPGGIDRPAVTPRPLSGEEAEALLAGVPLLPPLRGDVLDFAFRDRTLPAPRPGDTIARPFPPEDEGPPPVEIATLPLSVLRATPEGEVPVASHLSVAFSHAMVALDRLDDLPGEGYVELEPRPAGRWRWIDTRTLAFEPEGGRFPSATRYRVTVPFGTRALDGNELLDVETWSFATPPLDLRTAWPRGEHVDLDPVVAALFDQRIDPAAVLARVALRDGGRTVPVRLLTADEIERERRPGGALAALGADIDGRWLAFRPQQRLERQTTYTVALPPGLPSAEGPRLSEADLSFRFTTYGPFRFSDSSCGWNDQCRPGTAFEVRFTNPVDPASLTDDLVAVTPAVPEMTVYAQGTSLWLRGKTAPETLYDVRVGAALRDVFGQSLGEDLTVPFRTGETSRQSPWFQMGGQHFVVLDPWGDGSFPVHSVNYGRIDLALYAVEPQQWGAFIDDHEFWQSVAKGGTPTPPGRRVWSASLDLDDERDRYLAHRVDLAPALGPDGVGHALLGARPLDPDPQYRGWRARSRDVSG